MAAKKTKIARESKPSSGWISVISSLVVPIALGLSGYLVLATIDQAGVIDNDLAQRYLFGHPVSQVTTAMFCIGMASLALAAKHLFFQFRTTHRIRLTDETAGSEGDDRGGSAGDLSADEALAKRLLERIGSLADSLRQHALARRLEAMLGYLCRNGATESAEDELKFLADADRQMQQQRHALVRILIWATPMLGFLGTVMGISQALGQLNVGPENNLQQMMNGLQSSLYIAFDTTAQALVLSIVLMFALFLLERFESQFLESVDKQTVQQITAQFEFKTTESGSVKAVHQLGRRLLASTRKAVKEHTEIWRKTIASAENAWVETRETIAKETLELIIDGVNNSTDNLSQKLATAIDTADQKLCERWSQWQTLLSENTRQLDDRQRYAIEHAELMNNLLKKLEELLPLQTAINKSLDGLASLSRMDQVVQEMSRYVSNLETAEDSTVDEPVTIRMAPDESAEGQFDDLDVPIYKFAKIVRRAA